MKFSIIREHLLKSLQKISSSFFHHSTIPILNYLLLKIKKNYLLIIGANFETEIIIKIELHGDYEEGSMTVPSKKFFDIFRTLPKESNVFISVKNEKILIKLPNSIFSLATLPPSDFPRTIIEKKSTKIVFPTAKYIKELIEYTQFSMANQDIRHYLNGMLLEITNTQIRSVTTDGHRLSICTILHDTQYINSLNIIIPRKGITELLRILKHDQNKPIELHIGENNIRIITLNCIFTTKLIDGIFPEYKNILPKNNHINFCINLISLKNAIKRVSILSHEKLYGIRMYLFNNSLKITSNNLNQDEAEETLKILYFNKNIEICLNSRYILDILNVLKCETIKISLKDSNSSIKIEDTENKKLFYIVMPMKL
ncbi:MAG: beta sliding clamp [Candidatus Westeberhardia cardiocondylae]|nr:beta sliding clamp [Candidatus Westeberhardia cardiocondylae]